jgi:hypothetical protein
MRHCRSGSTTIEFICRLKSFGPPSVFVKLPCESTQKHWTLLSLQVRVFFFFAARLFRDDATRRRLDMVGNFFTPCHVLVEDIRNCPVLEVRALTLLLLLLLLLWSLLWWWWWPPLSSSIISRSFSFICFGPLLVCSSITIIFIVVVVIVVVRRRIHRG